MGELLVVRSKIKEYAKVGKDTLNVSGDFAEALSKEVEELVKKAATRANENGRSTLKPRDL